MNNHKSSIRTELPIVFRTLTDETVPARVKSIQFEVESGVCRCELSLEVDGDAAERIVQQEWFHLFASAGVGHAAFDADQPVEIRAVLRPRLARLYAEQGWDAENVLDALLPDADTASLRHTECWMATDLRQAAQLPDDLDGALNAGYRTSWHKLLDQRGAEMAAPGAGALGLIDQVTTYLQGKALKFEQLDDDLLRLRFNSASGSWISLIRIDSAGQFCAIYSVFPDAVPLSRREETAAILMSQNYDLTYGSFEMDYEDGELRFRSTLFTAGAFEIGMLGYLIAEHLKVMEHYIPLIGRS